MLSNGQLPCCRCGSRPRDAGLYLCRSCAWDPVQRAEVDDVEASATGIRKQRRLLVQRHRWHGHWQSRE